jgi:hypothetical protein
LHLVGSLYNIENYFINIWRILLKYVPKRNIFIKNSAVNYLSKCPNLKELLSMYRPSNPLATGYTHILMTMYRNTIHNMAKMISYSLTLISSMSRNKTIYLNAVYIHNGIHIDGTMK